MGILTGMLALLTSLFFFATGRRMALRGRMPLRALAKRIGAAYALYFALFVPAFLYMRAAGLTDIGRASLVRELLGVAHTIIPFSGLFCGYALSLLLLALLCRVPMPHPAFAAWLLVAAPVTSTQVLAHFASAYPQVRAALEAMQPVVGAMGMGCIAGRGCWFARADARLDRMRPALRRALPVVSALAALFCALCFPSVRVGSLQLVVERFSFAVDLRMLYAPVLCYAIYRGWGRREEAPPAPVCAARAARAQEPLFDRRMTDVIKGVALVMMFVHHFFTFPEWMGEGVSFPATEGFAEVFRLPLAMCVPVFAFLTGYFYAHGARRTMSYSIKKITDVLCVYWVILIALSLLSLAGGAVLDGRELLAELLGLSGDVMIFNWYICFYVLAMLLLPLLFRLPHERLSAAACVFILLPVFAATCVKAAAPYGIAAVAAQAVLDGACSLGAGILCARFALFSRGFDVVLGKRKDGKPCARHLLACAALLIVSFLARHYAPRLIIALPWGSDAMALRISMDMIYAPAFVYALAHLAMACPLCPMLRVLGGIGRYALHMWLISCAFFNTGKALCQPLLYAPGHPAPVLLWGLLLCYVFARLVDIPAGLLLRGKNRIFSSIREEIVCRSKRG